MKNSGIEWIGEIPDTWRICPAGGIFQEIKEKNVSLKCANALQFKYGEIIRKNGLVDMDSSTAEMLKTYTCVPPDAIMINGLNLNYDFVTQRVAVVKESGVITSAYLAVYPCKSFIDTAFACFLFKGYDGMQIFHSMGSGVRKTFLWKDFKNLPIVLPSMTEQCQIVNCLNRKCAQIDALILNQEQQIEKLKQYKQSLITEVVTKGLDKNAPLKDSGIEWIGKIGREFTPRRLKDLVDILDNYRQPITADKREQDSDVLYDYYGASGAIDKIDGFTIDDHVMLIGEDGANLRLRNLPLMYEINGRAWVNNHAHILKPKSAFSFDYLFFALEGTDITPYITGSAQPKLSQENLKNIWIPVPNYETQLEIGKYLRRTLKKVDQLIAKKQSKIEKLNQYKKSLIYEYVTGKKEVT